MGKGTAGIATATVFGVALFLRQKFMEKKEEKSDTPPMREWLKSFLEAMTEDRRQSAAMFRELAVEMRTMSAAQDRLASRLDDAVIPSLGRIENKSDALLQRSMK